MKYLLILLIRKLLRVFHLFPLDTNKIIYMSYEGKKFTCNPKYIYNYMIEENRYKHIWVLEDEKVSDLHENPNTSVVRKNSLKFIYHFLTSKIIISNASIPTYLPVRKSQKYIETWHGGGAYKKTGLSYDQTKSKIKQLKLIAKEVSLFISSSAIFTETKSKNHMVPKEKFFEIGMPRNDILFRGSTSISNKVRTYYGLEKDTKIVLYAPTYRTKDDDSTTYENLDLTMLVDTLSEKFGGHWVVFTRMHYYLDDSIQYKNAINVSSYDDMQELMLAADALITDYSSVMWDYSLTRKPAFVYAPDLEEYEKNRSFFTPPEKWPFQIAQSNEELAQHIIEFNQQEHEQNIIAHHKNQGSFEDGKATERIVDKIIEYTS